MQTRALPVEYAEGEPSVRGTALILMRDSKLRRALAQFFQARRWQAAVGSDVGAALSRYESGASDVFLFEADLLGDRWLERATNLAAGQEKRRLVALLGATDEVPENVDLPSNLKTLRRPFNQAQFLAALGARQPAARREVSAERAKGTGGGLPLPRLPIRAKITLPYVLLAVILAAVSAFIVTQIVVDSVEERYTNQLIEAGRLANEWMVFEEDRLLKTARALARTEGMAQAIRVGDPEGLRRLALPVVVNSGDEAVEFISSDGTNLLSLRRPADAPLEQYETSSGSPLVNYAFVAASLRGEADDQGDKHAGLVEAGWGRYFYVAAPIYGLGEEPVGAVLVGTSARTLASGMRQATLAQITLYGGEGSSLDTTFLEPRPLTEGDLANLEELEDNSYTRNLTVANIEYREILGPWQVRGDQTLGTLGISLPQNFLIQANRITRYQIAGAAVFGLVLVVAVGFFISNRITEPLLQVVQASQEVSAGNLKIRIPTNGNDEVASLANTFNRMVVSLRRSRIELLDAYDSTLEGWSKALELRDNVTEGHTRRVAQISMELARALRVDPEEMTHLKRGAILHDIGKMGIPDGILRKPAPLSDDEWEIMRQHPVFADEMLSQIDYLEPALEVPRYHHEWWDGSGYPDGLKGEEIPLAARIFAVADVADALLSDRPYRRAWSLKETLEYLRQMRGKQFDPEIVDTFFNLVRRGEIKLMQSAEGGDGEPKRARRD